MNPASELVQDNVVLYAVGISQGIKFSDLKEIAKRDDHIFQVDDFDLLNSIVKAEITKLVCSASTEKGTIVVCIIFPVQNFSKTVLFQQLEMPQNRNCQSQR